MNQIKFSFSGRRAEQDSTYLWSPSSPGSHQCDSKGHYFPAPIFLYCKHTEARRCLDAKEHQNNPRQTSKGLKHHLFHWWIWGLYPPPSCFYTHPMRSEEPANHKRLLLNFALVEFSIIKYGARGQRGFASTTVWIAIPLLVHEYIKKVFFNTLNSISKKKWANAFKHTWPKSTVAFPSCPFQPFSLPSWWWWWWLRGVGGGCRHRLLS